MDKSYYECIPGFVMIDFIGEENHPTKSLLARTEKDDTTYHKYLKIKEVKTDSLVRFNHLKEFILDEQEYQQLKSYITNNKREKQKDGIFRILLIDKCDTLHYNIRLQDENYFKDMMNTNNLSERIREYADFCVTVQQEYMIYKDKLNNVSDLN